MVSSSPITTLPIQIKRARTPSGGSFPRPYRRSWLFPSRSVCPATDRRPRPPNGAGEGRVLYQWAVIGWSFFGRGLGRAVIGASHGRHTEFSTEIGENGKRGPGVAAICFNSEHRSDQTANEPTPHHQHRHSDDNFTCDLARDHAAESNSPKRKARDSAG